MEQWGESRSREVCRSKSLSLQSNTQLTKSHDPSLPTIGRDRQQVLRACVCACNARVCERGDWEVWGCVLSAQARQLELRGLHCLCRVVQVTCFCLPICTVYMYGDEWYKVYMYGVYVRCICTVMNGTKCICTVTNGTKCICTVANGTKCICMVTNGTKCNSSCCLSTEL